MERVNLREPVSSLWDAHRAVVWRAVGALDGSTAAPILGGGGVLAARWGRRESTDLDLRCIDRTDVEDLRPGNRNDLARFVGGLCVDDGRSHVVLLVGLGRIGVKAAPLLLLGDEQKCLVNGVEAVVESNAQILRGKFERALVHGQSVVRDVYDVIAAGRQDPAALAVAVNALTEAERLEVEDLWRSNAAQYRQEWSTIRGRTEDHGVAPERAADEAVRVVDDALYAQVKLERASAGMALRTLTRAGCCSDRTFSEGIKDVLRRTGLDVYLAETARLTPPVLGFGVSCMRSNGGCGVILDTQDEDSLVSLMDAVRTWGPPS